MGSRPAVERLCFTFNCPKGPFVDSYTFILSESAHVWGGANHIQYVTRSPADHDPCFPSLRLSFTTRPVGTLSGAPLLFPTTITSANVPRHFLPPSKRSICAFVSDTFTFWSIAVARGSLILERETFLRWTESGPEDVKGREAEHARPNRTKWPRSDVMRGSNRTRRGRTVNW